MSERGANLAAALSQLIIDVVADRLGAQLPHSGSAPAALVTIAHEPDLSIEHLRRALGLTHSGTVRLVDRLESEALVHRRRGGQREVKLGLTRRGREAVKRIERTRIAAVAELLEVLSEDEQRQFDQLVARVLGERTHGEEDLRRICRLCSFDACERGGRACPVDEAAHSASLGI